MESNRDFTPATVFFGTKDKLVPVKTAQAFKGKMESVGSRSELILFEGQPHGFFNFGLGDGSNYRTTVKARDKFLTSLAWLEGKPTIE